MLCINFALCYNFTKTKLRRYIYILTNIEVYKEHRVYKRFIFQVEMGQYTGYVEIIAKYRRTERIA